MCGQSVGLLNLKPGGTNTDHRALKFVVQHTVSDMTINTKKCVISYNLISKKLNLIIKYEHVSILFYVSRRTNITVGVKEHALSLNLQS